MDIYKIIHGFINQFITGGHHLLRRQEISRNWRFTDDFSVASKNIKQWWNHYSDNRHSKNQILSSYNYEFDHRFFFCAASKTKTFRIPHVFCEFGWSTNSDAANCWISPDPQRWFHPNPDFTSNPRLPRPAKSIKWSARFCLGTSRGAQHLVMVIEHVVRYSSSISLYI